jgi:Flp pilus assembly secretin CpaC
VVLALALVGLRAGAEETLTLRVGQTRRVDVGAVMRVALGDPKLAEMRAVGSGQLELEGLAEGETTLVVWKTSGERKSYRVEVTSSKTARKKAGKAAPGSKLKVKQGETTELKVDGVTRVTMQDTSIANIEVDSGGALRVKGLKAGETPLLVWTREGRQEYQVVVTR